MKRITCLAMGLAVSIGVLSGCNKAPMNTAPPVKAPYVTLDIREDIVQDHIRMMQKAVKEFNITAEQKAKFKEIIKNYRSQIMTEEVKDNLQTIKKMVLADDVDETALTNALTEHYNDMKAKTNLFVDMMAEMREVLTEDQRNKVIERLRKMDHKDPDIVAHHQRVMNYLLGDLDLTTEQKENLRTLKDQIKALRAHKMEVMKPALISFVQTGDKEALLEQIQAFQAEVKPPIGDMVDFINNLSLEQRQSIVNKIEVIRKMMKEKGADPTQDPADMASDS